MRNITQIIFTNRQLASKKIADFYINAKKYKYRETYGWDDVERDFNLAFQDMQLIPSSKTIVEWLNNGFNVARNKRGWAFAYTIEDNVIYVHDVINCKYLTLDYQNTAQFTTYTQNKIQQYKVIGDAGYGYKIAQSTVDNKSSIITPQGKCLTKFVFDQIIGFHHSSNDYNTIYAVGFQGNRVFAIYQDGNIQVLPYSKKEYLNKKHQYYESSNPNKIVINESHIRNIVRETLRRYLQI